MTSYRERSIKPGWTGPVDVPLLTGGTTIPSTVVS